MVHSFLSPILGWPRPFFLRWFVFLFAGFVGVSASISCSRGGSGGGGGGSFALIAARAETGPLLPFEGLHINERIILQFTTPIDPASVSPDSVQVRLKAGGFSIPADGDLEVVGNTVTFVPRVPSRVDLSDAGFLSGAEYRLFLPSFPDGRALRSSSGGFLPAEFSAEFRIRNSEPMLLDSDPGRPRITAVAVDLNRDGVLESDGDPLTVDAEEFTSLDAMPFLSDAPVGLARAPLTLGLYLDQPILPATLFADEDMDGLPDAVRLIDRNTGRPVAMRLRLDQRYVPEEKRVRTLIKLIPKTVLPAAGFLELTVVATLLDFGTPPSPVLPLLTALTTEAGPATLDDALIESFDDAENRDPSSTAEWALSNSGVLVPSVGIGGNGIDGPLSVGANATVTLDTNLQGGVYQFESVFVDPTGVLIGSGSHPLRILCRGNFDLFGALRVDGKGGINGTSTSGSGLTVAMGGLGGSGGFAGGNANEPAGSGPPRGKSGEAPEGFVGGEGGARRISQAAGGGGGGHAFLGGMDFAPQAGKGGEVYGDEEISVLFGGAGGGGGGNGRIGAGIDDRAGGGGGGGGGVVSIVCGGTFSLGSQVPVSVLSANGGTGGSGANGSPSAPASRGGGGGGGGAGGAIKVQARRIADLVTGMIGAVGGAGGVGGNGAGARPGGLGSVGYFRLEAFDENGDGIANDFVFNPFGMVVNPLPSIDILDPTLASKSVGLSRFIDTGTTNARFSFDATDPETGLVLDGAPGEDLQFSTPPADGVSIRILFEGAHEDPDSLGNPDLKTATGFISRISDLNRFRFVRFQLSFDLGPEPGNVLRPVVSEARIRFRFDL